jgi:hypothetical protein
MDDKNHIDFDAPATLRKWRRVIVRNGRQGLAVEPLTLSFEK